MRDAMEDLRWVIGVLIVMGIVWFFLGGPRRDSGGPFIHPPAPLGSGETYGEPLDERDGELNPLGEELKKIEEDLTEVEREFKKAQEKSEASIYSGVVSLETASARSDKVDTEHLRIRVSSYADERVPITNWRLVSPITGSSATIGEGAYLPYSGQVNPQQFIFLSPGDTAIISTGRSPIGTSFRLNLCTGYFEQFQDFSPSLPRKCPRPEDESVTFTGTIGGFNDDCIDFIEHLPRCTLYLRSLPQNLPYQCQQYIKNDVNYSGCVRFNKNDPDFYQSEWRVFLGRDSILWKKRREVIKLLDANGKTVDAVTY